MNCIRCGKDLPEGAVWCCWCGRKQIREQRKRTRGNGEGTVYRRENGTYVAEKVKYYLDKEGKRHKRTASKTFKTKREAVNALPGIEVKKQLKENPTFREIYEKWFPAHEQKVSSSTMDCYKSAYKWFWAIHDFKFSEINIDDLEDCIADCPRGKRTKENMRALASLLYKYAIPRKIVPELNIAEYISLRGGNVGYRPSFTDEQIKAIKDIVGTVPYADYTYVLIYTGFRISELLNLKVDDYNKTEKAFIGGSKTAAGMNRAVTLSPKITGIVEGILEGKKDGYVFCNLDNGSKLSKDYFCTLFYKVLDAAGIDNPTEADSAGQERHRYSPHSCRHTFINLMKYVDGLPKVKLHLEGHANEDIQKKYQDISFSDLRQITDKI